MHELNLSVFIHQLFIDRLLGQIYRNELALECRKLGYEIEPHLKELFEIKGYTREQIEGFSKRHEQILNKLEEIGAELTTENKIWAWRKTRAKKNHEIGRSEKLPYWHEEADLYSIKHPVPHQSATQPLAKNEVALLIQSAVTVGIEHCSERKVAFRSEDIEKFVTAEVKPFSIHQLESAIAQHPELIKTFDGRYTTQKALARELATIKLMQEGKAQVKPIATPETVESYWENKNLTSGQKEAISLTATTTDQFIAWQGVAGAGKTYALNGVKQVATALNDVAPGYTIKGFAPSAEAAKVLGEELGIEANTVASLFVSKQNDDVEPNQIWIVDEAGLLGAENAYSLLQRAKTDGARVILVGDTRQLSAIEAGNPFKSLQSAGIATAHLNESLRQKPPELQLAVSLAAAGQTTEAISYLEQLHRIIEVVDVGERATRIAADYIKLSREERQQTLIIAGTHKERKEITNEIRTALKNEGTIGYCVEATQLRAKQNLTSIQTRYTHNYNIGDVVVPVRDYKKLKLFKSQPYSVVAIDNDKLVLSDLAGNHQTVDPMKFRKTLYKQENIEIAVGEVFKWTRNDKELGRRSGQEFTVTGIDGQTATIELESGKTDTIDLYSPLHLDYALVSTTYSSQGKTADRVLVSSTVDPTVSTESVYVAISRAKYDLKIYAENIDFLLEEAQESKAQETVLELLQPKAKVQVSAVPEVAARQKVEVSEGVTETPQLRHKEKSVVSNIERMRPIVKREPLKQLEIFWTPTTEQVAPPHIEANHWQELVEGSAIHPAIASLNFRSLQMESIEQEHEAWEYLMYSDKLERTNIGQLTTGMLKRYAHIDAGGWWCESGVNAISFSSSDTTKPQEKRWGCYKPNEPRFNPDKPGKKIKYEHPPKIDLGIFLLNVPDNIDERIYEKAGIDPNLEDRMRGFWYCTWKYNLPITITEGAKKAASLLSQGHVAIGLPGIYAGYRSKDEQGRPIKAHLHQELVVFATLGRKISFCFDYETRPETKRNIEIAISRTGSLLQQQGAKVSVVSLPGPEKGVDDLIVAHSPLAYEQAASSALPLQQWREHNKQSRHLAIVPPKKLSVQERKEQLKDSLLGPQPANHQNLDQSPEQISHDSIDWRQFNSQRTANGHPSINQSLSSVDQENRSIGEKQQSTYEQQQANKRTTLASGNYSDREPEPIESQSPELLKAISRHLELQTVEQLGADIAELNRSLANGWLRGQGAALLPNRVDGQNSTIINRATNHGSIERQDGESERNPEQLLSSISDYLEAKAVESSAISQDLTALIANFRAYQSYSLNEVIQKLNLGLTNLIHQSRQSAASMVEQQAQNVAIESISGYIDSLAIKSAPIVAFLQALTQQLGGFQHHFLRRAIEQLARGVENAIALQTNEVDQEQTIEAISSGINSLAVESAITQPLADLTQHLVLQKLQSSNCFEQLNTVISSYLVAIKAKITTLEQKINEQAIAGMSNYVAHSAVESTLVETVSSLQEQFAQYRQQLTGAKTAFNSLNNLMDELTVDRAIDAATGYVEQEVLASSLVFPALIESLTLDVKQNASNSTGALKKLDTVISSYLSQIESLLTQKQQQITSNAVVAISQQIKHEAITAPSVTQSFTKILENLSMLKTSTTIKAVKTLDTLISNYTQQSTTSLANGLRKIPLEEIAIRLGLTLDKHDLHKWWGDGQILSINNQKFYDHLNLRGGYGAIDLVMHVQGQTFKEALKWLTDGKRELPRSYLRPSQPKAIERRPFQLPIADDSKWLAVRQYLVGQRKLPLALVDELHSQGIIYADGKQNAVFLRQDIANNVTGASLRGTYQGSSFKGLATGSQRENGWFSFVQGEGELKRIVLVESAIDALSAAALAEQPGKAIFISTDGTGSIPTTWLQQEGVVIVAAHDSDRAGEEMAWRLAMEINSVSRAVPTYGKDWNEQLLDMASKLDVSQWKLVAQAISKPDAYVSRIVAVVNSGQPLPVEALAAMQQDFSTYKQLSNDLWQWHQAAQLSGYSDAYLKRIAEVAISLHHPQKPIPLSENAWQAMQQDVQNYSQVNRKSHRL
jgi:ATP-dependent exoDNAse (exonuclease V) alpha subunit